MASVSFPRGHEMMMGRLLPHVIITLTATVKCCQATLQLSINVSKVIQNSKWGQQPGSCISSWSMTLHYGHEVSFLSAQLPLFPFHLVLRQQIFLYSNQFTWGQREQGLHTQQIRSQLVVNVHRPIHLLCPNLWQCLELIGQLMKRTMSGIQVLSDLAGQSSHKNIQSWNTLTVCVHVIYPNGCNIFSSLLFKLSQLKLTWLHNIFCLFTSLFILLPYSWHWWKIYTSECDCFICFVSTQLYTSSTHTHPAVVWSVQWQ